MLLTAAWSLWALTTLATTYQVGPTRPYPAATSLPALSPGDIVEIDPATYHEVKRWTDPGTPSHPIIIRGVDGTVRVTNTGVANQLKRFYRVKPSF